MSEQKYMSAEQAQSMAQVKRAVKRITRKHKLFFRDRSGAVRRLDKISQSINGNILVAFIKGDADEHYSKLNADAKHWRELKPVSMNVHEDEREDYEKLKKAVGPGDVVIYYNGSWKPLVNLGGYKPQKVKEEKVEEQLELAV